MAMFRCKMCGGTIEFVPGSSVCVCDYCGTKQTLPRLDGGRRENLYDRAEHFRRNNEFDKAAGIYETLLNEDKTDAEAYWLLVLCRYGVEYVEDPATHKRVPTVNRAQYTSIFDDADYRSALQYADAQQRAVYEAEAAAINEIQKGILAVSQNEEPFDVFICYKETDAQGRRTPDSVLAADLYHQLTNEGFKVFFSRITLEDKLGAAYEPYIFAALNSARVMVVLGTRPEHFNAVWVKNEWSRYLALVKQSDGKKTLIPAYRDMDPYDLPEEFSHLQAQDMSKLGFMQDMLRGIKKLTELEEPQPTVIKETVTGQSENGNLTAILDRGFLALEDGEWLKADDFFEQALNYDAQNARAYLGKLMVEQHVHKQEDLRECAKPFNTSKNYEKAVRFGSNELVSLLNGFLNYINKRNENTRLTEIYESAVTTMNVATTEDAFKSAMNMFKKISGFKDSDALAVYCQSKAEAKHIEEEQRAEKTRIATKKRNKIISIAMSIIMSIIVFVLLLNKVIIPNSKYNSAIRLYNTGKYDEAIAVFSSLDGYKDSESQIEGCYMNKLGSVKYNLFKKEVGDICSFGTYEQNNNPSDGKEEIYWRVLDKNGMSLLLISMDVLDNQRYNNISSDVTWETCSLRKWLNGPFISNAFSENEQKILKSTVVTADINPSYSTPPGNNTNDKVFLLSIAEVNKYFGTYENDLRQCLATAYAKAQGAWTTTNGYSTWTLRSPGGQSDRYACVSPDGSFDYNGGGVTNDWEGIRPAMWIDLSVN